jgi:hypothetical protein
LRSDGDFTLPAFKKTRIEQEVLKTAIPAAASIQEQEEKKNDFHGKKDQNIFFFHIRRPRQSEIIHEIPKMISNENGVCDRGIPCTFIQ